MDTRSSRQARWRVLMGAVSKYYGKKSFTLGGVDYDDKSLLAIFDRAVQAEEAAEEARSALRLAVAARKEAAAAAATAAGALEDTVRGTHGEASRAFADFGFRRRKFARKSAKTKAVAVEKLLATRAARHTLGPRQKVSIHGVVVDVAPDQAPAPGATPTPAPAASAGNGTNGSAQPALLSLNGISH